MEGRALEEAPVSDRDGTTPAVDLAVLVGSFPVAVLLLLAADRVGAVVLGVPRVPIFGWHLLVVAVCVAVPLIYRDTGGVDAVGVFAFGLTATVLWAVLAGLVGPDPGWRGRVDLGALVSGEPASATTLLAVVQTIATGVAAAALSGVVVVSLARSMRWLGRWRRRGGKPTRD